MTELHCILKTSKFWIFTPTSHFTLRQQAYLSFLDFLKVELKESLLLSGPSLWEPAVSMGSGGRYPLPSAGGPLLMCWAPFLALLSSLFTLHVHVMLFLSSTCISLFLSSRYPWHGVVVLVDPSFLSSQHPTGWGRWPPFLEQTHECITGNVGFLPKDTKLQLLNEFNHILILL